MKKKSIIANFAAALPWGSFMIVLLLSNLGVITWGPADTKGKVLSIILYSVAIFIYGIIRFAEVIEKLAMKKLIETQRETIVALRNDNEAAVQAINETNNNIMSHMMRGGSKEKDAEKALFAPVKDLNVTMEDIRGMDETVKDIQSVIDVLKRSDELEAIGGSAPSGLLLTGAPGTGKTMMAKAIAGTCGMKFIPVSGSAFVDKYVGEGASRVRMLFDRAREEAKKSKVIIFIDEIDALCGARGNDSSTERDTTLNQLLVELDGFNNRKGIFVIGATNLADKLDEAITRPGRLDRTITVPMPDKAGRKDILGYYMKKFRIAEDINLEKLVSRTVGFSPAELKNLLNTAAVDAVVDDQKFITSKYVDEAYWKIIMKGNKRDSERSTDEDRLVAYHEAGHAIVNTLLEDEEVTEVTIIGSTSGAGGVTMIAPKEKVVRSAESIKNKIMGLYGGRAAEEVLLGGVSKITTGASSDIEQATKYIRMYLEKWGMGGNGLLDYSVFKKDGESIADAKELSEQLYRDTVQFMKDNRDKLDALAEALLDKRTLDGDEVRSILRDENPIPRQLNSELIEMA